MARLPWMEMTLTSLVAAFLLTSRRGQWSTLQFIGFFYAGWAAQFAIWALWATQLYPKLFSPLRHLPEPKGNSFFNGQFRRISAETSGVPQIDWLNNIPNDGVIRYRGLLNQERVIPTNPKALAEVLVTKNYDFQKPYQIRHTIGRVLGVGILLAEGDEHKAQRRSLAPAFAFRHIKNLYPIFWEKSREVVRAMTAEVLLGAAKEQEDQQQEDQQQPAPLPHDDEGDKTRRKDTAVMEVGSWASRATLDIIGLAGLGHDFGAIQDPNSELIQIYTQLFHPSRQSRLLGLLGQFIPGWLLERLPIPRNHDIHAAAGVIRATCRSLIEGKKEKMKLAAAAAAASAGKGPKGDVEKGDATIVGGGQEDADILSVALRSGGFTDDNLADQLMTFLAAGHETTASSMTWAIYMLCLHPEMQSRLREEVRARLPSPDAEPAAGVSSADVDAMPYLNAVCSEVLRYYGPVPVTFREAARDTSIQGHFVPKGTRVVICPWAANKSEAMWGPGADRFDPERWLRGGASGGASSNYAFMTFLHGPRSCIGSGFARAEFACLLAAWVGRFEFRLRDEEEMDEKNVVIKGGITARPAKGMHVYAKVLEGW